MSIRHRGRGLLQEDITKREAGACFLRKAVREIWAREPRLFGLTGEPHRVTSNLVTLFETS